jgi:soluble lytic murein transglycosylase
MIRSIQINIFQVLLLLFLIAGARPQIFAQSAFSLESVHYGLDYPADQAYSNFIQRGDEFYKQRDYKHAILNFNFARELEPVINEDFIFNFKIGYAYKSIRVYDSAFVFLGKASADPFMGDYALFQLADMFLSSDSSEQALALYKTLLRKFPQTVFYPEATLTITDILSSQKQFEGAETYLNLCSANIKNDPNLLNLYNSRILLKRGEIQIRKGGNAVARATLQKIQNDYRYTDEAYRAKLLTDSIRMKSGNAASIDDFIEGNNVLILQGYYQQALNELAENKSKFPLPEDQAEIEYNIARIYFTQGLYAAAVPRYQQLWNKYRHKEALFNLAKSARYHGDLDLSTSAYKEYRDNSPLNASWKTYLTYEIANNYSAKGDTVSLLLANQFYQEVRQKNPLNNLYGYTSAFRTAFNWYKLGQYDSCITHLEEIQKSVEYLRPKCLYWQAKAYEKMNQKDKAGEIYRKLAKERPLTYYGLLSLLHQEQIVTADQLFYINSAYKQKSKTSFFNFNFVRKQTFSIEKRNGRFYFTDQNLQSLESEFVKAWIAKEILEPWYAQRELKPLQLKYLENIQSALLYRNYLEFLGAYDLAVETNVAMKKKFKSYFKSDEASAKIFYPRYYEPIVSQYARQFSLDAPFVFAIIKNESSFKTYSISKARAIGLMQIMPFTGTALSKELKLEYFEMMDLRQPEKNILLGTYYLHQQARKYKNFIPAILGAYNAGPHRADFWMRFYDPSEPEEFPEIVELFETNNYIKKILLDRWIYGQM